MSRRAAKSVFDSPAFKAGVPMLAFMLGGSYVLSEFMQTHMELKDKKVESRSMRKFDMDKEHAGMLQKLQLDKGYTLSRIPRPDDEPEQKSLQSLARGKGEAKGKDQR